MLLSVIDYETKNIYDEINLHLNDPLCVCVQVDPNLPIFPLLHPVRSAIGFCPEGMVVSDVVS